MNAKLFVSFSEIIRNEDVGGLKAGINGASDAFKDQILEETLWVMKDVSPCQSNCHQMEP